LQIVVVNVGVVGVVQCVGNMNVKRC